MLSKPYTIAVDNAANITEEFELFDWVQLNIGKYGLEWEVANYLKVTERTVYYFRTEQQALLFALRWAQ